MITNVVIFYLYQFSDQMLEHPFLCVQLLYNYQFVEDWWKYNFVSLLHSILQYSILHSSSKVLSIVCCIQTDHGYFWHRNLTYRIFIIHNVYKAQRLQVHKSSNDLLNLFRLYSSTLEFRRFIYTEILKKLKTLISETWNIENMNKYCIWKNTKTWFVF